MPVVCAAVVGAKVRLVQKKEEKEKVFRIQKNVRAPLGDRTQKITLASSTTTTTKQNNPLYLETFSPSPSSVGIISDAGDAHGGGDGDDDDDEGEEEAPCASTSPSTPRWTPSTRGSRRAPPRRRRPLPLRPLRRLWPKPAPGPGAPRRTLGRPTWEFCILRTSSSSTGEERRVGFCFLLFGLTEETASCHRAHLPILLQRSPPPPQRTQQKPKQKIQQQLRLQHAREAHPDRLGPAAARGRAASGERVHSPFGEKKRTKKALPRPLRRKGSPLSHRPSSCSLLQKLQNQKQVFKRIHAAFVEASCNPFYTADSVRGRGKRAETEEIGREGGTNKSRREERDSRRFRNLFSHNSHSPNSQFNPKTGDRLPEIRCRRARHRQRGVKIEKRRIERAASFVNYERRER